MIEISKSLFYGLKSPLNGIDEKPKIFNLQREYRSMKSHYHRLLLIPLLSFVIFSLFLSAVGGIKTGTAKKEGWGRNGNAPIKEELLRINFANFVQANKSATGDAGRAPLMFIADCSKEAKRVKIALHPSAPGSLKAEARVGAGFISGQNVDNASLEITGGLKGKIENTLTKGWVELNVIIKDVDSDSTWSKRVYFAEAERKEVNMDFSTTVGFSMVEGHRYRAYIKLEGFQDSAGPITGKLDFGSGTCGAWYNEMTIFVLKPEEIEAPMIPCSPMIPCFF